METEEPWVVVWAIPKNEIDVPCWLMVKHIERGWELPGGKQLVGKPLEAMCICMPRLNVHAVYPSSSASSINMHISMLSSIFPYAIM